MLFELRRYVCMPGRRDDWVRVMEEVVIPFQSSKGMVILGSWVSEEDDTSYVWLRRFQDEAERKRLYAAVYESDEWKNELRPQFAGMLNSEARQVTRLIPTPKSPIR